MFALNVQLGIRLPIDLLKTKPTPAIFQKWFLVLFLASMVVQCGCRCPWSCCNANLAESSRWLQGGLQAHHNGQHVRAERLLSQAVDSRPNDPILREHLAQTYLHQGKTTEAISELMQAAEISGHDASFLVKIGNLYLANGQQIPAQQYATKALKSDRQLPEAWVLNAETKIAKGQLTDALSDYQRALSLRNDAPEIQIRIAELQQLLGRPLRALSTVEQMLSGIPQPSQPEAALLLSGKLLIQLKQPAQAVEKLKIATNRDDASTDSHIQLAQAQLSMGRTEDARTTLLAAQQKFPGVSIFQTKLNELGTGQERIAAVDLPTGEFVR